MIYVNDIFVKGTLVGTGATHYRVSLGQIENEEWRILNEDYEITFELPNNEGTYPVHIQLKNTYNISNIYTETFQYIVSEFDDQSPSIPTGLTSTNITYTTFNLTWSQSTDNIGVMYYTIYNGNVLYGTTQNTTMLITGLTSGITYNFSITASDIAGNVSSHSSGLTVTTASPIPVEPADLIEDSVRIVQVYSPSSTIINPQDGVVVDHCLVTLYNSSDTDFNLSGCNLYWKYNDYPIWHRTRLSGTIDAHNFFLVKGSKITGIIPDTGTVILVDWNVVQPDLDCSVDWSLCPVGYTNEQMVSWAIGQNFLFVGTKTGTVYLSSQDIDPSALPENPYDAFVIGSMNGYIDLVGLQGKEDDGINLINGETLNFSTTKKSYIYNRVMNGGTYVDTNNNSTDFERVNINLSTTTEVDNLIKSSRSG